MKNTATKGKTDKIDFIKIKHLYALKVKVKSLSRVRLFAAPWTVAHQAPPSMGFSRQEYWSGLPFPSPGESSQSRDQTRVSRIAGRRFNLWATREAQKRGSGKWKETENKASEFHWNVDRKGNCNRTTTKKKTSHVILLKYRFQKLYLSTTH